MSDYWIRGEMTALCRLTGILPCRLSNILHRRQGVSWRYGLRLQSASRAILGSDRTIPVEAWVTNRWTDHPAFFGRPFTHGE